MRLTIAYSKIKKRNLVLINNATYQRETLSERPIRQPLLSQCKKSEMVTLQKSEKRKDHSNRVKTTLKMSENHSKASENHS